ncbi:MULTISPECIES: SDR family NAD(P)-dependent oxidoreductase [unclassified Imperialibacter]|uniref:SDR family NAD(P)-dependent oxidoreductase n=1 Tax=unclassified Imperialibacter TaxID=2629706 RepID=UPI00125BB638|nr:MULTISPECIES: 3-oxoacyl-ACP reductase family protein [unclassified Imperialibacter]CAD5252230.1 Short-chain dehydrogenase/reductase SDR [Imperialibacter sp. 75]CAD5298294.1 Short-chain dehydrogenase/reductase SDR [Imperialibacter sp. 89]VVT13595.1 Short-chain dehydrogenase/reductase SDR [Imperialibacter sp. EC-SDR9]
MTTEKLPGIKLFDLTGRTAIITGGSKGLGLAMAEGLASAGANIMLVNRTEKDGEEAAKTISSSYGVKAISFAADVTNQAQTEAMAKAAMDTFGRIDILINSAGINIRGPIDELSLADFNKVMEVNVNGTWLCNRAVTPYMKKAKRGSIINMASTLGLVGVPNRTPYASSKGAIVQMTRALALEFAPFNITVNAICPGPFLTEMNAPIAGTEDGKKFIIGATALERWGELKEIQGAAIFLASDAATYMVGSLIAVDGGWTAR